MHNQSENEIEVNIRRSANVYTRRCTVFSTAVQCSLHCVKNPDKCRSFSFAEGVCSVSVSASLFRYSKTTKNQGSIL
jgi:hypothetical protein